jgi:hypothetical protein
VSDIEITSHGFKYSNFWYFRDDIPPIRLCSYGHKRDAVGPKSFLEVQNQVQRDAVRNHVRYQTSATIDWDEQKAADVNVNGSFTYFTANASGGLHADWETARSQHLRLVLFGMTLGPLTKMLNTEADGARKYLRDEGSHGRIVCGLWIATDNEVAETMASAFGGQGTVTVGVGSTDVTVSASSDVGTGQSVTVVVGPGSFAYQLAKVTKWTSDDKVQEMRLDQYGTIDG